MKVSILRAKEITLDVLRKPKTNSNEKITPFTITYDPNNPNVFLIIKQSFDNFSYSKIISNIFKRKILVKSMSEVPNLGMLLCRSKFDSQLKNLKAKKLERIASASLLKASLYQFKGVNQIYLLKNSFNCESFNFVHAVICTGGKEEYIGDTGCLVKE